MHEAIQKIQHLDPQNTDIRLLAISCFEMHERFTQQGRSPQSGFLHAHGITQKDLWFQELVEQGEDDAVEKFFDLALVLHIKLEMRTQNCPLEMQDGVVANLSGGI